jgi:hypothetical protein
MFTTVRQQVDGHDANWESAQPGTLIARMAGIFRRRRRVSKSTVAGKGPASAGTDPALRFEPLGRSAVPAAWYWSGATASVSRRARADAEEASAEVALLREEVKREQADKERALAEAERRLVEALAEQRSELDDEKAQALADADQRLVRALAEQRAEMQVEVRNLVAEAARLREELANKRAEIEAELAAIRRQRSETEPHLAAMVQPSAHAAHH